MLVFLPGRREIARLQAALLPPNLPLPSQGEEQGVAILPLHGDLPVEQQSQVLQPDPHGRRRVVLATNVAESSVTLPGVRTVIDSGLARDPRFAPGSGFSRLDVVQYGRASCGGRVWQCV